MMDGWMGGWMEVRKEECVVGWVDGKMDRWMDGKMGG